MAWIFFSQLVLKLGARCSVLAIHLPYQARAGETGGQIILLILPRSSSSGLLSFQQQLRSPTILELNIPRQRLKFNLIHLKITPNSTTPVNYIPTETSTYMYLILINS